MNHRPPLGEVLLRAGKITAGQLDEAMRRQNGRGPALGDLLQALGWVTAEDVAQALADQLGIPFYELGEDFRLTREEVALVPEEVARRHGVIALRRDGAPAVTVVMKDPIDADALDTVRALTRLRVVKAVSTADRITAIINRFYREEAHIEQNLRDLVDLETGAAAPPADEEQLRVQANDAPVVRFVNLQLMSAVRDRASDIHFEPGEREPRVRLRVDGYLREATPPPPALYPAVVTRLKLLAGMDISERRLPQDGRFKFKCQDRLIDVRASALPEVHGEKLVLRLLDRAALVLDFSALGFAAELQARFLRLLERPEGMILLTGPTGSGKTTTLYCALHHLRHPTVNIQTVEDPVEYQLPGINQMMVREKIGLTFAAALRTILRQDPDIIMVGEIRDRETADMAVRAALTGHLVLSTLHTNDAPSAFSRLRDIGVDNYLVAATVNLVLSQRLVRRICAHCRQAEPAPPPNAHKLNAWCPEARDWTFHRGRGCEQCGQTGYHGRLALVEFLEVSDAIRQLVAQGASEQDIRARAAAEGLRPLARDGAEKIREGLTTIDELGSVWQLDGGEGRP